MDLHVLSIKHMVNIVGKGYEAQGSEGTSEC